MTAQLRTELGTRAARRLRKEGLLPANLYGQEQENILISVDAKTFNRMFDEGHRILALKMGNRTEHGLIKEVQYDAFGSTVIHVDFTRIRRDQAVEIEVPVEIVGVAKGVASGGTLSFPVQELLISGLPGDIPEHFPVNIDSLDVGQFIRLKDLEPPPKCRIIGDPELVILGVTQKRAEAVPEAAVEEEAAQPEVIGRKKEEEEEAPEKEKPRD